ncbi:MFS family permease [Nakamurella flavida]|uniref:MFS transporter n=1 Tax=Nakamurella flavida TaxID=363630 RepID=UPI002780E25C|nr:MFS transporter [Nakamurella flavida]MDP9778091.1 MFS family permease [Nakamurella flavida]
MTDPASAVPEEAGPPGRARRWGPDTRPLAVPAYRRLFIGQVVTVVGTQLTAVAVQQQIFQITGSSAWVGIASLVALVPLVVFGLLGGAIADTYDRRTLLIITSTGIGLTSVALWLATFAGGESVWVVLALLAVQQGFFAVNQPTRSAIIPRLMPAALVPSANALGMTVFSAGVIVGPLLFGVLVPVLGLGWLYFLDAVLTVAVIWAVVRLPAMPPLGGKRSRAKVVDGLSYLWVRPLLLMTFVVDIIAMVFGLPRALFPQMAQEIFGGPPEGGLALGALNAAMGIGVLVGGLTGGWIQRIHRQGKAIVVAILVWGAAMSVLGLTSALWVAVLLLAVGGWADMISSVFRSTILQVQATDEMRGRMQGVFLVVVAGGPRVADLLHGLVASATTTQIAVTGGGIACVVLTLVAAAWGRTLIRYDTRDARD